jgi:hypothetical protein
MFGCLRRLIGLALVVVLVYLAWNYRDRWWPGEKRTEATTPAAATTWEPVSDEGAGRARSAIESLSKPSGPVFANVRPGDLTSYVFIAISKMLPPSASNVQSAAIGNQLFVRATVSLEDFKAVDALGPLSGMFNSREPLTMGGTLEIVHPGLAQFKIESVKIRDFSVPKAAIPKLLAQIVRGARPDGVADNALPLTVPPYIADVRIGKGKVTLYKTIS